MKLFKRILAVTAVLTLTLSAIPASAATDVVDFEDGNFSSFFIKEGDGDPSLLSVVDFNGSKALFIDSQENGTPKVVFNMPELVGASNLDKVKTCQLDLVVTQPDAAAVPWQGGAIGANQGADAVTWYQGSGDWSLQDDANGTTAVTTISTTFGEGFGFVNDTDAIYLFMNWGNSGADMYVDNIKFLDADGNAVALAAAEAAVVEEAATTDATPKTGTTSYGLYFLAGAAIMLAGAVVLKKRNSIEA